MKVRLRVLTRRQAERVLSRGQPIVTLWLPEGRHYIDGGNSTGFAVLEQQGLDDRGLPGWQSVSVEWPK